VNPSKRALRLELKHAKQIVDSVAAPELTLVGIYEQPAGVRRSPFNQPFLSQPSASVGTIPLKQDCSKGTEFQKKKCLRDYQKALADWRDANAGAVESWKQGVLAKLTRLARDGRTEEAPGNDWDLRGAFLEVGQSLAALATPVRCVVLLGGLVVRNPPDKLRADLLSGTSVVVSGWHGTQAVQDQWSKKFSDAGASVAFLPQAVTDLKLVDSVRACLRQS
jgi:hypothetical protein